VRDARADAFPVPTQGSRLEQGCRAGDLRPCQGLQTRTLSEDHSSAWAMYECTPTTGVQAPGG